jgi:lactoylglutathione lyase
MTTRLQKPDYIVIYVSDMQRSTAFYRDVLGLPLKFSTPGWTEFDLGSLKLALHRSGEGVLPQQPGRPPAGVAHLAFVVDNIQELYTDLKAKGIYFSLAPERQVTGNLVAVMHDPDGFGITLQEVDQEAR